MSTARGNALEMFIDKYPLQLVQPERTRLPFAMVSG